MLELASANVPGETVGPKLEMKYSASDLQAKSVGQLRSMCEEEAAIEQCDIDDAEAAQNCKQALSDLLLRSRQIEDQVHLIGLSTFLLWWNADGMAQRKAQWQDKTKGVTQSLKLMRSSRKEATRKSECYTVNSPHLNAHKQTTVLEAASHHRPERERELEPELEPELNAVSYLGKSRPSSPQRSNCM